MTVIEVFADVACPFTHVGLHRFVDRRQERNPTTLLRVRAWPLELVNGEPLPPELVVEEVQALREQVAPDLFTGFDPTQFPETSLPAMAVAAAAYRHSNRLGERVSPRYGTPSSSKGSTSPTPRSSPTSPTPTISPPPTPTTQRRPSQTGTKDNAAACKGPRTSSSATRASSAPRSRSREWANTSVSPATRPASKHSSRADSLTPERLGRVMCRSTRPAIPPYRRSALGADRHRRQGRDFDHLITPRGTLADRDGTPVPVAPRLLSFGWDDLLRTVPPTHPTYRAPSLRRGVSPADWATRTPSTLDL